jgi:universal stress protein A
MKVEHILVPTDFSAPARHNLDIAVETAALFSSRITLLYVVEPVVVIGTEMSPLISPLELESKNSALKELTKLADAYQNRAAITTALTHGSAWRGVCDYASEHAVDLIVISTHGHTGLRHFLIGSNAERIVQHAPCPVLVTRRDHITPHG